VVERSVPASSPRFSTEPMPTSEKARFPRAFLCPLDKRD
jgi:hypothetical protein